MTPVRSRMRKTTDIMSADARSRLMARIRGRDNRTTELRMVALLRSHGITGWRRHRTIVQRGRAGAVRRVRPDFVFPGSRTVLFIDGCFWHGCSRHCSMPKQNKTFWQEKILANRRRDSVTRAWFRRNGWQVIRVWEHALRKDVSDALVARIAGKVAARRDGGAVVADLPRGHIRHG